MTPQLRSAATSTLATSTQTAGSGELTTSSSVGSPRRRAYSRSGRTKMLAEGSQVIMEGELEKRGDNMLQLWKKKVCVLTKEGLAIFPDSQKRSRCKEFPFQSIKKLDCVERSGKYIYFTIVTTDNKEIDFRCSDESSWNATITMALIDYQNKKAIQHFRERQGSQRVHRTSSTERPAARMCAPEYESDHGSRTKPGQNANEGI